MSLESKEKTGSLPPVDPQVINSALNELHLDDDDMVPPATNSKPTNSTASNEGNVPINGANTSSIGPTDSIMRNTIQSAKINSSMQNGVPVFPPPHQMMGMNFIPYSQMMMPPMPPHGFPNNMNPSGSVDPFWQDSSAAMMPDGKNDEKNVSSFRRQTFHTISQTELIGLQAESINNNGTTAANAINSNRNHSISLESNFASLDIEKFTRENPGSTATVTVEKDGVDEKTKEDGSDTYPAAAYPYGGPLLQPNPGLPGHHTPMPSLFPGAYGFTSPFQSYSTIMNPHSPIPMHHHPQMGMSPQPGMNNANMLSGEQGNDEAMLSQQSQQALQQQNGGTPPPWMYGNHPFGHMVAHPHAVPSPHNMVSRNNKYRNNKANFNGKGRNYHKNGYNNGNNQKKFEESTIYNEATLDQFIGNIYSLCKDQHGCRFLQKQLDLLGEKAANPIFEETEKYTVELMTDPFGNYLIQKLLERVTKEQRLAIAKISSPYFVDIALNPHGTRALQKLVECVGSDEEAQLVVASLQPSIIELSRDLNGNHVVQKCLQVLKPEHFQFIFDAACENCIEVSTHRHGCCVLQRCLDRGTKEQCQKLCEQILNNINHLSLDPYGNYVVQYVISKEAESFSFNFSHKIVNSLKKKVEELSLHKFGSNVIEKILRTPVLADTMIDELLKNGGDEGIQILLNDSYGNYVLQTALDVSHENNSALYKKMCELVTPLLVGSIRNTPHGRRLITKLNME